MAEIGQFGSAETEKVLMVKYWSLDSGIPACNAINAIFSEATLRYTG